MTIRATRLAPIIIVVFTAGIAGTMALNLWKTDSAKVPVQFTSGEFEGKANPADIRGSYSFDDVARNFDISVETLAKAFGVADSENAGEFQVKELEEIYGQQADAGEIGTDSVRLFVARYAGLPYDPEDTTLLPSPAVAILKDKLSAADYEALRAFSVNLSDLKATTGEVLEPEAHESAEDTTVKGNTTFDDLLNWGLSVAEIEETLGIEIGTRSVTVKEYLTENSLEFSTYRAKLQELVDGK